MTKRIQSSSKQFVVSVFAMTLVCSSSATFALVTGAGQPQPTDIARYQSEIMNERETDGNEHAEIQSWSATIANDLVNSLSIIYAEAYDLVEESGHSNIVISKSSEALSVSPEVDVTLGKRIKEIYSEAAIDIGHPVDSVSVKLATSPTVKMSDDGLIEITVEVEIARHIAEDDIDWVEIIPYVMAVDRKSAEVTELEVRDMDYYDSLSL